ncbi:hypothetical protein [Pleurocapsa sp. FMAR1]|uniref:hypothetical protein n=1 Tax=Pleurocapsa sp. FMAR1 TaxID=3040204 RepID=UPI0029C68C79|nr:hypothetical protein [Pleurocapsa sp. FMAR1]
MNLTKLATATIISLSLALPTGVALAQENGTANQNLNQAGQNVDNAGENLKDAGGALGKGVKNTGQAAGQGLENAGNAIEEKSNWGWLGLLGLIGLFGLAGGKKTTVVERRDDLGLSDRPTTYNR